MKFIKSSFLIITAVLFGSAATIRAESAIPKDYPLKQCPVSDEKLGEHGKAIKAVAPDGTEVYLCCKSCMKDFKKDPEKYAKMVNDAKVQSGGKK